MLRIRGAIKLANKDFTDTKPIEQGFIYLLSKIHFDYVTFQKEILLV